MAVIPVVSTDPTGSTTTENPVAVAGVDGGGIKRAVLTDTAGSQTISGFGATSDAAASSDTGTFSLLAFFKRLLSTYLSPLLTRYPADISITGMTGAAATVNNILDGATAGAAVTDCAPNGTLYGSLIIETYVSGTISGGTISGEWSNDGTNWKSALLVRSEIQVTTTGISPTGGAGRYITNVEARYFRARISSALTGGGTMSAVGWLTRQIHNSTNPVVLLGSFPPAFVAANASSTNSSSTFKRISTADTNATSIKSSAGRIYSVFASNNSASWRYLKIYSKASAPTVGTDVPVAVYGIPPGSSIVPNYADIGLYIATGITMSITAGIADSDNTAIAANEVAVVVTYA
jgi:hypothetical protein